MPASAARGEQERIAIATYNIHGGRGMDRRYDPGRTAGVIRQLKADVVALQEVDDRRHPGGMMSQLEFLARETGMEPIPGPAFSETTGHFGNAILTRHRVRAAREVDLTMPGREPRQILDAEIEVGGTTLRLVTTHLGLGGTERSWQTRRLIDVLRDGSLPGALLGDFNWWRPRNPGYRMIESALGNAPAHRTYPARWPLLVLDRMWSLEPCRLQVVERHESRQARTASDHLPVRGVLSV